jgi:flagellar FliL protein
LIALNEVRDSCVFIKEDEVAEEKAAAAPAEAAPAAAPAKTSKQTLILIALAVINMVVVGAVGFMLYQGRKKDSAEPKIEDVIKGEHEAQEKDKKDEKGSVGKVIPLETFVINIAGSKGRRLAKINLELDVENEAVSTEIDQRKAQIRDIIIVLLSGKTYDQISSKEGRDQLKEQIKDTVNAFLTKGKIKDVYFTDFIYS